MDAEAKVKAGVKAAVEAEVKAEVKAETSVGIEVEAKSGGEAKAPTLMQKVSRRSGQHPELDNPNCNPSRTSVPRGCVARHSVVRPTPE